MNVKVISTKGLELTKSNDSDSGYDIRSAENMVLRYGTRETISTGIFLDMTECEGSDWVLECQVRPRSGMASRHGITVVNSPGTIDNTYLGEVKIILLNTGIGDYKISSGDRIAQLVFNRIPKVNLKYVDIFEHDTDRGEDGFGSTGVK